MTTTQPLSPTELYAIDTLLTPEQVEIRDTVRRFADEHLRPHLAGWFEAGELPVRELARELGSLGVLGMHLEGYGCAGTDATSYGLACLELEAADSGIRSLVSVQGSLAMFAIHEYGSEEQREQWLPGMAAGELIGCFGLTEPDAGSDPGSMRTTRRARRRRLGARPAPRCGSPTARSPTWRSSGRAPRARSAASSSRRTPPASPPARSRTSCRLRASVTSELVLDGVRLPADAMLPGARGLSGPLGVPGRGPVRHRLRRPSVPPATAWRPRSTTPDRASSSAGRSPGSSSRSASSPRWRSPWATATCSPCISGG